MEQSININKPAKAKMAAREFALYISLASIIMLFTAFLSAFLVRQAAGNWHEFPLPKIFFYNILVMMAIGAALHYAFINLKKAKESAYKGGLILAMVLGCVFIYFQYLGWMEMFNNGILLDGNPSGSFIYIISWAHAAHILGGIVAMLISLMIAFRTKFRVTEKRKLQFKLVLIYWHFVDILWIYLLIFFITQ